MSMKRILLVVALVAVSLLTVQCASAPAEQQGAEVPLVYALYTTPIEEPWISVINEALQKQEDAGRITYEYVDNLGYAGDYERVLREVIERDKPDLIFGDCFGNEEAARRVASENADLPFVLGSNLGPADPNFAVFDDWIHEPAYLSGMIAGFITESGIVGVVAGYPVAEVNRIVNAFIDGVHETNAEAEVRVTFINAWYDPMAAKEQALAMIDAGADVMFAERFGVIEAAVERDVMVFGMMTDQYELGPDNVITGPVWNMEPTVEYALQQIEAGTFVAQDLKDFSMMAKGGAMLAPFHGMDEKLPAELVQLVEQRQDEIKQGLFRVNVDEAEPIGSQ